MRLRISLVALALSGVALASCGGGDEVSADEYVGSICTAMGAFQTTIVEGQTAIQESVSGDITPEEGKQTIADFYSDATAASEQAASAIAEAGVPDVENGEEISDAITQAFQDVNATFEDSQSEVDALPTDSPEAFDSAAQEFGTSFQEDLSSIGEGLAEVGESPELEQAAQDNEECSSLQSAGLSSAPETDP